MHKPVIGLALGSGAARGWSHIGVIEVLEAAGIRPDVVAGCSVGAFVGAAYAAGKLEDLRNWAEAFSWRRVVGKFDLSFSGGLISTGFVNHFFREFGVGGNIEDFGSRFAAVATDYGTGLEEWFETGPVDRAVRASLALPGILAPVRIGNRWFVDGGLVNPVPVSVCRALGADFVIAVNLNGELVGRRRAQSARAGGQAGSDMIDKALSGLPSAWRPVVAETLGRHFGTGEKVPGYFDILTNSINIMQDRITRSRLAGEPPHALLVPRLGGMGFLDFENAARAIGEGRRTAEFALPEIRRMLDAFG
ncbi:patatin-like phospholipase family protein [Oricola thermophila]|uniref:Patatin-like phospholipase family protein n=1 Tax=Oricola thermophila TaxID=2742145 RepID=A0A6N1VJ65_9HYPH|nr:patatin-like phospholipase family protein [Oricola thermophila]QKV19432.1 patatin-like phospholipase family protein [Oricola thermophila]